MREGRDHAHKAGMFRILRQSDPDPVRARRGRHPSWSGILMPWLRTAGASRRAALSRSAGGRRTGAGEGGPQEARPGRTVTACAGAVLVTVATIAPARADPAAELAGLFMQACIPYAGNPKLLRAWASSTGLPELPEAARRLFLRGAKGTVFDASVPPGKYALISSDDGLCSAVTNQANGSAVVAALETDLRAANIAFRLAIERDDKQENQIYDREYLATKNGHGWRILAATVRDPQGGQAMLTAGPE